MLIVVCFLMPKVIQYLLKIMEKKMANGLNEMQQKIVDHTEGAVMVLAGAGSGKTKVLTHRIANILNKGLAYPSQVLAITFTNKAANEMRERLAPLCQNAGYIWAQTFHSFCARVLRSEIDHLDGYNRNFSIYDESDKKLVLKKVLKNNNTKEEDYLCDLMHDISSYKNKNISLDELALINSYKPDYQTNINFMREYEQVMKQNNALDFDDLLIKTLELFKTSTEVREKYQHNFRYILIDEFQDTNNVQYDLVKLLADYHKNIFAVGDEDQSIYSWRGASVGNIQRFLKDFSNSTLYKLEQNYRSTKSIIDCANKVIKHNHNRIDKTLFTENEQGVRVEYASKYTDKEEAEYVVQQIYSLTHSLGYQYKDIAILMRLNALTRSFEDKLLSYDIPYRVFGGLKFYERAEIKNLLAYLKLIVNPQDNESFMRIINFPKRSIGEAGINKLLQKSYGQSLMNTVYSLTEFDFVDKTLAKFRDFKALMEDFKQKSTELKVSELAEYMIKALNLEQVYATGKEEDENRFLNLSELVSSIEQFEKDNENISLEEYLQNVSLVADIDTYSEEDNAVTLATVHSAKGLEFKVVFVVGLEERYFPIIRDYSEADMEEERRLMYVAVTRAMERLYLTNCSNRYLYGKTNFTTPSRFLEEMGFKKEKEQKPFERFSFSGSSFERSAPKPLFNSISLSKPQSTLKQNSNLDYKAGEKVLHNKFGMGTVISYDKGSDILTINFDGFGNKILSAKFANLKKM